VIFVFLKAVNGRLFKRKGWGVELNADVNVLIRELDRLGRKELDKKPSRWKENLGRAVGRGQSGSANVSEES